METYMLRDLTLHLSKQVHSSVISKLQDIMMFYDALDITGVKIIKSGKLLLEEIVSNYNVVTTDEKQAVMLEQYIKAIKTELKPEDYVHLDEEESIEVLYNFLKQMKQGLYKDKYTTVSKNTITQFSVILLYKPEITIVINDLELYVKLLKRIGILLYLEDIVVNALPQTKLELASYKEGYLRPISAKELTKIEDLPDYLIQEVVLPIQLVEGKIGINEVYQSMGYKHPNPVSVIKHSGLKIKKGATADVAEAFLSYLKYGRKQ